MCYLPEIYNEKRSIWASIQRIDEKYANKSDKPIKNGHTYGSLRLIELFFSSPEPKAQRWAYSIPMVRRPSVVRRRPSFTFSNIFFSETGWPIKAKFYVEPHWVGGTKVCSRHLGHMTKMAATPMYGKNPSKIFFSRTSGPIFMKLGM